MALFHSVFPLPHSWLLILSLVCGIVSIVLCYKNRDKIALAVLCASGFLLRLFMAHLDPFLHDWDERFHALVARNMMHDPFKPMLRASDWIKYDYRDWAFNHIWLHKQPLFMWQMALSMKIFGVSEYAIRYPGVLMGTIGICFIYRLAWLCTENKRISFISACLACYSYYQLELMSGLYGMDQNDTAFDFYVLASIWAFAEYLPKRTLRYAALAGLFAGCAVLNKWLTGTLVFSAWGLILLFDLRKKDIGKHVFHFIAALLVCMAVFLPWQLYIFHRFPMEAKYEFDYASQHLFRAIEGHSGDGWFYINQFGLYFGEALCYLVPVGLVLMLLLKQYRNRLTYILIFYFALCFIFFSFVAQTKMAGYFMVAAPMGYIFIAVCAYHIFQFRNNGKYTFIPSAAVTCFLILNLPVITHKHDADDADNIDWHIQAYNTIIYKHIPHLLPPSVHYALNVKDVHDFMFYNNGIDGYRWMWNEVDAKKIMTQHASIAIFHEPGKNDIPSFLSGYDSLYILPVTFK